MASLFPWGKESGQMQLALPVLLTQHPVHYPRHARLSFVHTFVVRIFFAFCHVRYWSVRSPLIIVGSQNRKRYCI